MGIASLKNSLRRQFFLPPLLLMVSLILGACRAGLTKVSTFTTTRTSGPSTSINYQVSDSSKKLPVRITNHAGQSGANYSPPRLSQEIDIYLTPTSPSAAPTPATRNLFPNSEIVYSPSAIDFDVKTYLETTGSFLSTYRQYLMITGWTSGADIITRVAVENSINPRLLLALLEYQSGCVFGQITTENPGDYLMGALDYRRKDLYGQLIWAVEVVSRGYYGRRTGVLKNFLLQDGTNMPVDLELNAGTLALQYFFAQFEDSKGPEQILAATSRFVTLYNRMFGDPWQRDQTVEPLISPGLSQPTMILPFQPGKIWSFTLGPHPAWERAAPLAALDFAPASARPGCVKSNAWVVAAANGLVTRSEFGLIVLDLDGDGHEQTGWVLLYLHIDETKRVPPGTRLHTGDIIGHPSCNGGRATGTHIHIARKYNGEWIPAGGSIPFVLSGWIAHSGTNAFQGTLTNINQIIHSNQYGMAESQLIRYGDGKAP